MSAALPASDLTWMRDLFNTSLPRTCTLTPNTGDVTNAGDGTWEQGGGTVQSGVQCSFMAAAGNERLVGGAVAQIGNYILTFPATVTGLGPKMTVAVDASGGETARTFQLVAPLDEPSPVGRRWLATEG